MTKTNKKATAKPVAKLAKRAPGNSAATQQKAADNVKALRTAKPTAITICKTTTDGDHIYVQAADRSSFTRPVRGDNDAFRAVAVVGKPFAAALRWHNANPAPKKPIARLARGIGSGDAPQSAAALRSARAEEAKDNAKGTGKGKARTAKAGKAKQPSKGAERTYKPGSKKNEAKPGTFRHYLLSSILAHKDTASAKAAHAKGKHFRDRKLDFNWAASQGYITFTN